MINVIIILLTLTDIILIYIVDYLSSVIVAEIIFDFFATILIFLGLKIGYERNKKILKYVKYVLFWFSVLLLIILVITIVRKNTTALSNGISSFIPLCFAYYILLIKIKLEE